MDALTHAMESYTSRLSQPFTDAVDLYAVEMIAANLRPAVAGERTARGALLYASALAGIGFTHTRLGNCHAMAHPLGGVCGVPTAWPMPSCCPMSWSSTSPSPRPAWPG